MLFVFICLSYLIGTFPSGMIVARSFGGGNVTTQGSGSIGATNIARVLGKKAGLVTLFLDVVKGILGTSIPAIYALLFLLPGEGAGSTLMSPMESPFLPAAFDQSDATFLAGLATVLGHCLSLPGLKGGKGVATSLGVLLTINPLLAAGSVGVFVVFFASTKIVSLASLACAVSLPMIGFFLLVPRVSGHLVILALMSVVVAFRHRSNIGRLVKGEEPRFSAGKGK